MFARRTGIALALIAVVAGAVMAFALQRDGASPARGGAAAVAPAPPAGCRVTAPAMAMHGTSGLIMLATNVKMDPKTGRILSCNPVRGLGPLTYDLRYGRATTQPLVTVDPRYAFGGVPG
jgi:hypothetical protein